MPFNDLTDDEVFQPVGYIAACLAHIRAGHPIDELDTGLVIHAAPTQTEVDHARHMAEILANGIKPYPITSIRTTDGSTTT